MATHIFDIDGTIVLYHTNIWIKGAKEKIINLHNNGDQIIFITMRGIHDNGKEWSIENTKKTILKELDDLKINYTIIFGVSSPRIIHDDNNCYLDQRITNQEWINDLNF